MSTLCTTDAFQVDNGTDNHVDIAVENANGDYETSLATVTRVTFTIGDSTIDSDVVGDDVIWWTDTISYRGETIAVISLRLGGQSITAGTYTGCKLTVYTAALTNGWRYATAYRVTVV